MKDAETMAYINLFAVLGALEELCAMDENAKALLPQKPVTILFDIKAGPAALFTFDPEKCSMREGRGACDIRLPFSSYEKFNAMISGTFTPIPSKGFTKIGFLTKRFMKMTDILSAYLKADEKALENPLFFDRSTELMLYVIGGAIAQIGNHDRIGRFSASNITDGTVMLSIHDGPGVSVIVKDHCLRAVKKRLPEPRAVMEFESIRLARRLFDGKENAMDCIGKKKIAISGMISMLDNINRILDRVSVYLA
ncbi:MAG TPA: hypothetical protein DEF06_03210 [Clostridiales bacterium]|nr:hypothetical protein [Clostridiales bacterium]